MLMGRKIRKGENRVAILNMIRKNIAPSRKMRILLVPTRLDALMGDVFYAEPRANHGKSDRSGIRERIGKEVDEALGQVRLDRPETGGQVHYFHLGQVTGQEVVNLVGKVPVYIAFRLRRPGPHHHVVLGDELQEAADIGGIVLAVPVHQHDHLSPGPAYAGLDRGPVSLVVRVAHKQGAVFLRLPGRVVQGTVIYHEYFVIAVFHPAADVPDHPAYSAFLVISGNDYGNIRLGGQAILLWAETLSKTPEKTSSLGL